MTRRGVEITCPKCRTTLASFAAVANANLNVETYEPPYLWIPDDSLEFLTTHRIEHVLNDRQDVSGQRHGDVREARERGSVVRKKHRFSCHPCGQSLPVREERLWPALDRLAEAGHSSTDLDLLARIVTYI